MVRFIIEGRGEGSAVCREALVKFLEKAGVKGRFRVQAGRGRGDAYRAYCKKLGGDETVILIVDSESAVAPSCEKGSSDNWSPWLHLQNEDNWKKPKGAEDIHAHLMVRNMEYMLVSDPGALKGYYGTGFNAKNLPKATDIESVDERRVEDGLQMATRRSEKGRYHKGRHSFQLLARVDPEKVASRSKWAKRLIEVAKREVDGGR